MPSLDAFVCFEYTAQLDEIGESFRVGYAVTRQMPLLKYVLLHFVHLLAADAVRKLAKVAGHGVDRGATIAEIVKVIGVACTIIECTRLCPYRAGVRQH